MHTHSHGHEPTVQTEGHLIRWASFYDGFANIITLGRISWLRRMTIDQALLEPGENILDVGCGTGSVTIPAKMKVGERGRAAGIDPAPEMITVARQKASRARLEIDFRVGVIEALPFPDGTFDVVTSSLMMHHLPENLQIKGLSEIRRVLKPGGRLLIADMMRPDTSLWKRFFTSLALHRDLQFGLEDLSQMLREAGFEGIKKLEARFLTIWFVRATKPAA